MSDAKRKALAIMASISARMAHENPMQRIAEDFVTDWESLRAVIKAISDPPTPLPEGLEECATLLKKVHGCSSSASAEQFWQGWLSVARRVFADRQAAVEAAIDSHEAIHGIGFSVWRGTCGHVWDRAREDTEECPRCAMETDRAARERKMEAQAEKARGLVADLLSVAAQQGFLSPEERTDALDHISAIVAAAKGK